MGKKDTSLPRCWRCGEILFCNNGNEYYCQRCRDAVKQYCRRTGADRRAVTRIISDRLRPQNNKLWAALGLDVVDENDDVIDPALLEYQV